MFISNSKKRTIIVLVILTLLQVVVFYNYRSLKEVDSKDVSVALDPTFQPHLGKKCDNPPSLPENPALRPILDVPLPKNGVFLSCADVDILDHSNKTLLECYYRTTYKSDSISKVYLDGNFKIASDIIEDVMVGQDPRVFNWNRKIHVTDNLVFQNKIFEMNNQGHKEAAMWNVPNYIAPYKNVSPIPMSGEDMMFADFEGEKLYYCKGPSIDSMNCNNGPIPNVEWHYERIGGAMTTGWKYRGGSAGKQIGNHTFVGFGHLTNPKAVHHDIFFWTITSKPDGSGFDVIMKYVNHDGGEKYHHAITDPTTLICIDNAYHVITAESDNKWGYDQGYYQRVYRIVEDNVTVTASYSHYDSVPLRK